MITLLAQVAPPGPIDWVQVGSQALAALTPILVFLFVWVFKSLWSQIPASVVVFSTPILGYIVDYVLSYITGLAPASPLVAAALGLLAIALREILTTLQTKGFSAPVTITKRML